MEPLLFLTVALLFILIALTVYRMLADRQTPANVQDAVQAQMQQTANMILQQMGRQQESQDRNSHLVHSRLDQATRVVSDVQGKLMQLEEANKRIFELGKDINSLQKILQAPKLRGTMGEVWLAELIGQIIPAEHYRMQYAFKSGEVCDAVIFLRDGLLLPVDAKFSLENFTKMLDSEGDEQAGHRKTFVQDMKKRIDEIARKYILPHENTMEFAFMYVPAENVYYQAFIHDDAGLLAYAFSRRVVPVSPSSFYAYLQLIMLGLRGLEIEKGAKVIQKNLAGLQGEFAKFRDTYEKVGGHLRHAQQSFDQTDKRLGTIENKFQQIAQPEIDGLVPETALVLPTDDDPT